MANTHIKVSREFDETTRTNEMIAYILMILGLFTGIFWIAGGIWAYVKKGNARQSHYGDHYRNIIQTFWGGILGLLIGTSILGTSGAYLVLFATWFWCLYHITRGLWKLTRNLGYMEG